MKLPSFRRIFKADYAKEFQQMVDTLSGNLNTGIEVLYDAMNKKVSLRDNIQCDVKDVQITVNSAGIPINTLLVNTTITAPEGASIIKADNLSLPGTFPTSGLFISFTPTRNGIIINHITGLQANQTYSVRIIVWG